MSNFVSRDPLPSEWVEQIFGKLSVRYGRQFLARWDGIDIADVKADWADQLAGFVRRPDCIAYALDHLPTDKPPLVGEFRALCNSMPEQTTSLRLVAPRDPMPEAVREKLQELRKHFTGGQHERT